MLRVIFFRKLGPGAPIGACELCLICHCESRGCTADEVGLRNFESRAQDPFMTDNDRDIVEKIRDCFCLEICNGDCLARMKTSEREKWPLC